jgi:hypothetical protein
VAVTLPPHPAQAVQPFREVGERLDSQARDGRLPLPEHGDLLIQGQPGHQIVDSPFERQIGIAEWLRRGKRLRHAGGEKKRENNSHRSRSHKSLIET